MDTPQYAQLLEQLGKVVVSLTPAMKAAGKADALQALGAEIAAENSRPVTVLVCGEFKRGKSTFLNALTGRRLCPTDTDICTSVASVISYGPREKVTRHYGDFSDIKTEEISLDELEDYTVGTADEIDNTIFVEIELPLESLKNGLRVIDTPGVGGLDPRHGTLTNFFLPKADVAVFMTDVNEPMSSTELSFYRDRVLRFSSHSLTVLNKIDMKSADDVDDIRRDTIDKLRTFANLEPAAIECIAVSSIAEITPGAGYGESNFATLREALMRKAAILRNERAEAIRDRLSELVELTLAPLQAQLDQIETPDVDRIHTLTQEKAEFERRIAELNNPNSEFRRDIDIISTSKREEMMSFINRVSTEMSAVSLPELMRDPHAMEDNGGQWIGSRLNDMIAFLASDVSLRLNEMFDKIAALPQFGGQLNYHAQKFHAEIAGRNIENKLPVHKRIMSAMGGFGIASIGLGLLNFLPVIGQVAIAVAGIGVSAHNVRDAIRAHNEGQLRQIYQPQISVAMANLRTYVEARFQEFQREWLRVLTERAESYRNSTQESIELIQEVKQQLARGLNMKNSIEARMRPLKVAAETLARCGGDIAERKAPALQDVPGVQAGRDAAVKIDDIEQ